MINNSEIPAENNLIGLSFSSEQSERQDWVDNACHGLLTELAGWKEVEWNIEHISAIREAVQEIIVDELHLMTEMEFYPYIEIHYTAETCPGRPCSSGCDHISKITKFT